MAALFFGDPMNFALPRLIGHRGAAALAPENTLAGLRRARAVGVSWVEFDVRIAGDGTAVLMHDATVDRTTDGTGLLADYGVEALSCLDAGSWFDRAFAGEPPPTLARALGLCAELCLGADIEIKRDRQGPGRDADVAVAAVARALNVSWSGPGSPMVVSSFDAGLIERCATILPDVPRMLVAGGLTRDTITVAKRLGCVAVACDARRLGATGADPVRSAGLDLIAYTVNAPDQARKLYDQGVAGLVSDCPDRLAATAGGR